MGTSPAHRPTHRRPLLLAVASGAAAVTGLGVAARNGLLSSGDDESAGTERGALALTAGAMGVESLEVPLADGVLVADGPRRWRSRRLATTTHSMVGFTWRRGEPEPHIDVSSRIDGSWQPWRRMPHVHDAPDPGSGEAGDTVGTELAWVGAADGIRLRVHDSRPADLTLVLLHPTALPSDRRVDELDQGTVTASRRGATDGAVPPPDLHSRRDWGANESLRDGRPVYIDTIKQVHVHHTVNSNDYRRRDVPALIRGMYAYHTQSLGWSDIGYNFLVDRFGRVWVGRAGGPDRPVRGAHTLGFNGTSTGVSVIGNFETATPSRAVLGAVARVAAWKLDMYGRDPKGRTRVRSEGSDKFRAGRRVTLPVIDGHRDTNDTACPGRHLYDALPTVRRRARRRIDRYTQQRRAEITRPFTASGEAIDGEQLTVADGTWTPADTKPTYAWTRDGVPIASATGRTYRLTTDDVGSKISARVTIAPEGYQAARQDIAFPSPVRARTKLSVQAVGRRGRCVVRVTATAPGLDDPPTGSIEVTLADRGRTVALVAGKARVVFGDLPPGPYRARVAYPGNATASVASAADGATVKPMQ